MKTGIVKFFNKVKGFGFIIEDETGKEVFVHTNDLKEDISDTDKVQFDVAEGKKGLNCINVSILK